MTDVDTYWRTRCVGEAIDQGYTFLRLACGVPEVGTCRARNRRSLSEPSAWIFQAVHQQRRVNDEYDRQTNEDRRRTCRHDHAGNTQLSRMPNIEKVVITPTKREAAHHRNWNAAWVMGDEKTAAPVAWQIATKLQNEFDLIEDGAFSQRPLP